MTSANRNNAIGIFDSGIGGLTVFKEIAKTLPNENIIYLGDTARVPFGTKSRETVIKYTIQNSLFLLDQGIKAIVIACNTASAYGLETIRNYFKVPVLGVIEPGAKMAVSVTKNKKIGVIGTEGTIRSQAYQKAIASLDPKTTTQSQACPLLVPLAEEGWFEGEVVEKILSTYLADFKKSEIDTLILGCTHYPLFKKVITKVLSPSIQLVDSAVETAQSLKEILAKMEIAQKSSARGTTRFFSTDAPERMQRVGKLFLGEEIKEVTKVEIF